MKRESRLTKPVTRLPELAQTGVVRAATEICERLQGAGHEALFVGGFVRDWLAGIDHVDVDIATSAHPEQVEELFDRTHPVGKSFGVVLVELHDHTLEVATFRTESGYTDFRRPDEVEYGTLEGDAARRDFTINALYYDPIARQVKDFHAGRLDLRRRVLRTVGPPIKRFGEDALRLLRAVRFTAHYGLEMDERTTKSIKMKAPNLAKISMDRVGHELLRILAGPHRGRAVRLMADLKLWEPIAPEVAALEGVAQGSRFHPEGDVLTHTCLVLDALPPAAAPALVIGALLHDVAKPVTKTSDEKGIHFYGHQDVGAKMAREICERLRWSGELTDEVADLVSHHMLFMHAARMRPLKLKRLIGHPHFNLMLELHRADSLGSDGDLKAYEFCIAERDRLHEEHGEALKPAPLATGDDLIALGLPAGPRFTDILDSLHDEQLEGRVRTRDQAIEFLKHAAKGGAENETPTEG